VPDGRRAPLRLRGQTVVVIGAASELGLAVARAAKAEGAQLIMTDPHAGHLEDAADEIGAEATAPLDATDPGRVERFLRRLPTPVDHVLIVIDATYGALLGQLDLAQAHDVLGQLLVPLYVSRFAIQEMGAGGSLLFVRPTSGQPPTAGRTVPSVIAITLPALIANLALESAAVRINLIVAGSSLDRVGVSAVLLMTSPSITGATLYLDR
jgi:NAD(P)-dependent dehydrogenase (short-subunit alcohol dehydrogenase family)